MVLVQSIRNIQLDEENKDLNGKCLIVRLGNYHLVS